MKNKYIIRSKISEKKFREILRLFCEDLEASKISSLTGVKEQCLCRLFRALRVLLVEHSEISSKLSDEIELDKSYFGSRRVRGKHSRGVNTPVFGLLKRNGKVYTQVVRNCSKKELEPLILKHAELAKNTVYSDKWAAYDGLVDYGAKAHYPHQS